MTWLQALRTLEKWYNQAEIASMIPASRMSVWSWSNGHKKPTAANRRRLAKLATELERTGNPDMLLEKEAE